MKRTVTTTAALALFALVGLSAACGAPSSDPEPTASGSSEALIAGDATCTTPFTHPTQKCYSGRFDKIVCVDVCESVSGPLLAPGGGPFPVYSTPIPPPSALANMNCTWGLALTGGQTTNIWACQTLGLVVPPNLGAEPSCPSGLPTTLGGEKVAVSSTVRGNPFIGDAIPQWTYVFEELNSCGGSIGGGCKGGCALPP